MTAQKIYFKITLAIILGMGLTVAMVKALLSANDITRGNIIGRVLEAKTALPKIAAEPYDLVMFFGSSMTEAAFSPRQFDQAINAMNNNIKSFNFGFGGLNPYFQDFLSRRIVESFQKRNKRLKIVMIEFNPFQTTSTRWQGAQFVLDSYITMLTNNQEIWKFTQEDISRGIRLYNIKYIRDNISAEMISSYFGRQLFPPQYPEPFKVDEKITEARKKTWEELSELFNKRFPDFNGENWHYGWQGAGPIAEERSVRALELFAQHHALRQNDAIMKNYRQRRILTTDIEEMHFEPLLIEHFIQIVKNFQQISDKVIVIMLPRNTKWIKYTPEGKTRLANTIEKIESATAITIHNHQELEQITPEMFSDATHLASYNGDIVYTDFLIKKYGKEF